MARFVDRCEIGDHHRNGTKNVKRVNVINPLYFVPMAKPQKIADDNLAEVEMQPLAIHNSQPQEPFPQSLPPQISFQDNAVAD